MPDQNIAQCMDCGHKEELEDRVAPGTIKCPECGGPVTQYVSRMLSPEELAKYGPVVPTKKILNFTKDTIKQMKPTELTPIEEEVIMTSQPISREEYLIRRRDGEKRTAIFDSLGLGTSQYYKLLTEWGIKDVKVEQKYIDLIPARKEQPTGLGAINTAHQEEMNKIDPPMAEVVDEKAADAARPVVTKDEEIDRLRNELADMIGQRNQIEAQSNQLQELAKIEIERLATDFELLNEESTNTLANKAREVTDLIKERDAYYARMITAEQLASIPVNTPQNLREFHVVVDGIGGVVAGELGALSRYINGFNQEFHLEVHMYEIAPVEII